MAKPREEPPITSKVAIEIRTRFMVCLLALHPTAGNRRVDVEAVYRPVSAHLERGCDEGENGA
jgi:hypothetical protein